jgi:hypothetical protein
VKALCICEIEVKNRVSICGIERAPGGNIVVVHISVVDSDPVLVVMKNL